MKTRTIFSLATACIISAALLLSGCGGGGGGSTTPPATLTVTGTASEGALILGKAVKLKDADGKAAADVTTNSATGAYSFNVTGFKAPFLVTVTGTNGTYVSLAPAAGTANINPITTTVVALAAGSSDPAALFTSLTPAQLTTINTNYAAKATEVSTALQSALPTGVSATDYFTGMVTAGKGMDSLFDSYKISVTPASGITVTTTDASATTVLAVPTVSTATVLPVVTKISTIALSADKSSAIAGQTITIAADVKIAGNAAPDNTIVTFATDAGSLSAATATTSGGRASVSITASAAAVATVTASVNAAVLQAPLKVTFTSAPVQYSQAILKLKTTGTVPGGSKIGAWGVTVKIPASGISIKTASTGTIALDSAAFFPSGVAAPSAFSFTYSGTFNVADSTSTTPYLLLASLGDTANTANGMSAVGEVATIVFDIASGAALPTKSSFVLSNKTVASTAAGGIALTTVDLDFDLTLK